jgi:hypothetical protein
VICVKKVGLTDARIVGLLPPKIGQIEITDSIVAGLRVTVGHALAASQFCQRYRRLLRWRRMAMNTQYPENDKQDRECGRAEKSVNAALLVE